MSKSLLEGLKRSRGASGTKRVMVAAWSILAAAGTLNCGRADSTPTPDRNVGRSDSPVAADSMPVFHLVEGARGSPDPYTPRVLDIPAGEKVALDITDNIGGCALVTVFPGLGVDGGTVRARVPVGQTRRVVIRAATPGRYRYHCSQNMFFGEILAH